MLVQFISLVKENDTLQMSLAFSALVLLNFIASMWYEIKNKDLKLNDLTNFVMLIVLNFMFLFGVEIVMFIARKSEELYYMIYTLRIAAWVGITTYYAYGFYNTLIKLGLKSNPKIEEAINSIYKKNTEKEKEDMIEEEVEEIIIEEDVEKGDFK